MEAARSIHWERAQRTAVAETPAGAHVWFPDALVNTCHNAVDRSRALRRKGKC